MRPIHVDAPDGTIVNPVLPGGLRRARRRRLPRLRRDHGRAGADRAGARHRAGRGRADAARDRRQPGREALRADRGDGRHLGRAGGKDGLEGISNPAANLSNQPIEMIETDMPLRGARLRPRPGFRRAGQLPRRARLRARVRLLAERRCLRCAPTGAHIRPTASQGGGRGAVVEHRIGRSRDCRPCRWRRSSCAGATSSTTSRPAAAAAAPARARSGARARRRARREGDAEAARERYGVVDRRTATATAAEDVVSFDVSSAAAPSSTAPAPKPASATSASRTAVSRRSERCEPNGRDRCRRPHGRTGLHRHPQPLRLHAAHRSACDERAAPGRHAGSGRQLRLRLRPDPQPAAARRAIYGYNDEVPITWSSAGEYFEQLDAARPAVNVISLVPNGQLRLATLGLATGRLTPSSSPRCRCCCASGSTTAHSATRPASNTRRSKAAGEDESDGARAERRPLRDAHARARRGSRRRGGRGPPHRSERRGSAAGLAPPAAQRARGEPPLHRDRRRRARRGPGRRVRHAHAPFGLTILYAALPAWALGAEPGELAAMLRDPAKRDEMRPHR